MLAPIPVVERRFALFRLAAYVTRAIAVLLLLVGLMGVFAVALALFQLFDFGPFLTSVTLVNTGLVILGALACAAAAEFSLLLLAVEENTRASAAAAAASAQALQKQAEMATALATIAQNTRFAADDLLKAGKLLELMADEQRRGHAALPELTAQLKELAEQGRTSSARLTTTEQIARAFAQRFLAPPPGGA